MTYLSEEIFKSWPQLAVAGLIAVVQMPIDTVVLQLISATLTVVSFAVGLTYEVHTASTLN
jgi:hypothetical protein